jgi:hypothetical protein
MSIATRRGRSERAWQYHSRSDSHSKTACWTLLFDMLLECEPLRNAALAGRVGFGINHVMVGPINKTLDLVVTVVPPNREVRGRMHFADVAAVYGIVLSPDEAVLLGKLPMLDREEGEDVSEVAIAVEAKACMTEHIKSLPRLHAEILATGYLAKRAVPRCISVSYSLVNAAPIFVTPSGDAKVNKHNQPEDARRVVEMLATAVPTVSDSRDYGYDVVGVTVLDCRNDGSAVEVVQDPTLAPKRSDHTHYERMIRAICSEYRSRFGR